MFLFEMMIDEAKKNWFVMNIEIENKFDYVRKSLNPKNLRVINT